MKPKDFLSPIFFTFLSIVLPTVISAQSFQWADPVQLTFSPADSRNATVKHVLYNGDYDEYVFWEQTTGPNSSNICLTSVYSPGEPQVLIAGEDHHCTNVQVMPVYGVNYDVYFFLFYESDQNGNSDIYYVMHTDTGMTEPELLAGSDSEEFHLRCSGNVIVWQESDKILTAQVYLSPLNQWEISVAQTVDSINCYAPVVQNGYSIYDSDLFWLKNSGDSTFIYRSNYWNGSYQEPMLVTGDVAIASLKATGGTCGSWGDPFITWESIVDGLHTIHISDPWLYQHYISDFQQEGFFTPFFSPYSIPVDEFNVSGYMSFVYGEEESSDIWVNEWEFDISPFLDGYINLTESPDPDVNPAFFNGREYRYYSDIVMVWESKRDDYWQLFFSNISVLCGGGVNDPISAAGPELEISPNPCRGKCDVGYTLDINCPVSLTLYTIDGKQLNLLQEEWQNAGKHLFHLDFSSPDIRQTSPGIYMLSLKAGENIVTRKIVLQ